MLEIPSALQSKFDERLKTRSKPGNLHGFYRRWLRYYLDCCQKYHFPPTDVKSVAPFIQKLQEKAQEKWQQEQASAATAIH